MGSSVLAVRTRHYKLLSFPKAGCQVGLTSLLLLAGAGSVHDAAALNETRTLSFHHTHSNEDLTITFKRDGRYDEDALKKLNHYLRDWRTQDETTMDRRLFDILWEVYRDVDGKQPINIISSYRSPATNAMLRRRSSGVARFSQHMLGHAMDFYIPGVPLEQIRYAGLRLQRGGVGFYPTSGSPFVHLDTGSIRHWPRMTHDQLARVFPDGRTVHVPSDGTPLKGYELARADIERRGNGDGSSSGGNKIGGFLTALFTGKSAAGSDEDDEGAAPAAAEKPAPVLASAKSADSKPADPVPMPRAKPQFASTIQLAAADAQIVPAAKAKPAAPAPAEKSEPKPETPADIINARGFWGDDLPAAKQATAAQIAALKAREAVGAADPQATASVSENFNKALAYAPANAPVDRNNIVAASAPVPRSARPTRNAGAVASEINTVVAKGTQGQGSVISTSTRISAAKGNDLWMRVVMLAPSASNAMQTTVLGDTDMTLMRAHFVKPQAAVNMTFSNDPMLGMSCDSFTGSATATLSTTSFVVRTAALR
ncbi:ATP-binding protein [Bradyrhizobium sp. Leo121]|nr:ATP-binding protein [Bradyrhizobium sp. Leo121]